MEYLISKTSAVYRKDGCYEYLMIHIGLEHPTGELELSDGMIVNRDFVFDLITHHDIEFYTIETSSHNKNVAGLPVFVEDSRLRVLSREDNSDDLGELPVFSVEVY